MEDHRKHKDRQDRLSSRCQAFFIREQRPSSWLLNRSLQTGGEIHRTAAQCRPSQDRVGPCHAADAVLCGGEREGRHGVRFEHRDVGPDERSRFFKLYLHRKHRHCVSKSSNIKSFADMAGKKSAVASGTTNEQAIITQIKQQKIEATIISVKNGPEAIALLESGNADGFASDKLLLVGAKFKSPD